MSETLANVIKNKHSVYLFREFLHELYNAENLSFWLEIEDYKSLPDSEKPTRAREIYNKYFDPKSKYEINVEGKVRKELDELIKNPDKNTFSNCQGAVWKVMELDCFPKFAQSEKYKEFKGIQSRFLTCRERKG